MRGMGYSNAFFTNWWHNHPSRSEIYQLLFEGLRPSILRVRNPYRLINENGLPFESYMKIDQEFIAQAERALNYRPKILLSSWTPPADMKVNGRLRGATGSYLRKNRSGEFVYSDFAQWWVESLQSYRNMQVVPDYISIQNEPDYLTDNHDCCEFIKESDSEDKPKYYRAAFEVHEAVARAFSSPPILVGPETAGVGNHVDGHPENGQRIPYIAFHLYGSRDNKSLSDFIGELTRVREIARNKHVAELWMTEYATLGSHERQHPLKLASDVHHTLTVANASVYLHWDGAWASGMREGTLILVDNPENGGAGYSVLQSYYWFKHFCRYIRPEYKRVEASTDINDVLVSAWADDRGVATIILINQTDGEVLEKLPRLDRELNMYYSTLDVGFEKAGVVQDEIVLKPTSITTLVARDSDI